MPRIRHVGRLGRAGGGRQQREVAAEGVGRDEDRLVAADVGLRREGVHRLGARQRARDGVEADRRHALRRRGLRRAPGRGAAAGRPMTAWPVRSRATSVGGRLVDAEDDVGLRRTARRSRRSSRRPRRTRWSGMAGAGAGAGLDEDLEPGRRAACRALRVPGRRAALRARSPWRHRPSWAPPWIVTGMDVGPRIRPRIPRWTAWPVPPGRVRRPAAASGTGPSEVRSARTSRRRHAMAGRH